MVFYYGLGDGGGLVEGDGLCEGRYSSSISLICGSMFGSANASSRVVLPPPPPAGGLYEVQPRSGVSCVGSGPLFGYGGFIFEPPEKRNDSV